MSKNLPEIIERLMKREHFKNEGEVASLLGLTQGALSNHKKRGTIPLDALLTYCELNNLLFDWLLTGEGPMEREPAVSENHAIYNDTSDVTKLIIKVLQEMPEDQQREILKHAEEKKLLRELMEERKDRKDTG